MTNLGRADIGKKCELHAEATVDNPKLDCEALIVDVDSSNVVIDSFRNVREQVTLVSFFVPPLVDDARKDTRKHALVYLHPNKFKVTLLDPATYGTSISLG